MIVPMTKNTRTSVASTCRYSAMPPHTPATTLFVVLRSRRVDMAHPFTQLMCRGDRERDDEAQRNDGLLHEVGDSAHRHREHREQTQSDDELIDSDRWQKHRERRPDRDRSDRSKTKSDGRA